ncbi:hypothetical protein OC846_005250 [Tilletia horrida]|uniref:Uncharacterized protein n=1 Tax=Tilletia horrida TaxID=155126 RepID=A0AAN6JQF9_9BASI|nr:hypothetical protein OC846_005250 [Tilletia horrida]KAK0562260.1 hypothetical protein OC861_005420 [Tilletia horrida]
MASPLSAGAGGALKSLQRVASRDKLQKEQASKKEQKKAQQRSKSGLHAKERVGSTTASSATSENESGPLNASSPRHRIDLSGPQESAKHQMSAHAEADRLIESDRIEAEHLESHVIKHQGDQLPPPTQQTSASQSEQLSAAFMPQYQVRQTRNHRKTENGEEPEHKSKTDLVSSAHDQPGSTSIEQDEPDPIAARKTKQSWHAQLEADRARVGAAIGDMVISRGQPGDRHANRGNHDGAGWRRWRLDDRSAEIKAAVSSGAAGTPQLGLVWHGPGLGLPGRLSDMSVAVKNRIFGQGGDRQHADGSQQRSQPGVMHLAGVRLPFGLPLPHSLVEWTTAALGAGVGLQVLTWALGGNEQ